MHVPGDRHDQKTCSPVYNPAGFSIGFAMVRSSPQCFDSVLSIVVWCGVPSHHQIEQNPNPKRLGFLFLAVPEGAWILARRPPIATTTVDWRSHGRHAGERLSMQVAGRCDFRVALPANSRSASRPFRPVALVALSAVALAPPDWLIGMAPPASDAIRRAGCPG